MSVTNPTNFSAFRIDGVDRRTHLIRVETWRTVNGVGTWKAVLGNPSGVYNNLFDVQNSMIVSANDVLNVLMTGEVDGPAVTLTARDLESDWDEYVELRGVDLAQDLLFHNDFEYDYPNNTTQTLDDILDDVFNTRLLGLTNINYAPLGGTPTIGAASFKEGGNFLGSLQELMRRAGYIFYVDDLYNFTMGEPGFDASVFVARSRPGDTTNSIIGDVTLQERDGDKHYNYVKLYGKNPMFDAYTEQNAADWTGTNLLNPPTDETANVKVGEYAVRFDFDGVGPLPYAEIDFWNGGVGRFNYAGAGFNKLDFSKGTIGCWIFCSGGSADGQFTFDLIDDSGTVCYFGGENTRVYSDNWCWISAPLGQAAEGIGGSADNEWHQSAATFNWKDIREIWIHSWSVAPWVTPPDYFIVDGLTLPVPPIAVIENVVAQGTYRRRPYVDSWSHIRTQNAIQRAADMVLAQSESTYIDHVKFMVPGSPLLKYTGQTITVDIPSVGMNSELFYTTSIHHIVEPYSDVSGGYGFDWVTEVEAAPTSGIAFDHSRLSRGPLFGSYQRGDRAGIGLGMK